MILTQQIIEHRKKIGVGSVIILAVTYYFSLPENLFETPYSNVLQDRKGHLLSATIAADGQWRFPLNQNVPDKFKRAIVLFEDKRFYSHPGVDPLSLGRALKQNIQALKIVSGGSTISMQVIRLARKNKRRTFLEKTIEIALATRLELRYTKDEILALYAAHAPFGGNVVGIEAACWRYFGRQPDELSWSEAALLAVLPNNPSLIHLSKNRGALTQKRNRLLAKLVEAGMLDDLSLGLALSEPIPQSPIPLPREAPHLLDRAIKDGLSGQKVNSTIDVALQHRVDEIVNSYSERLYANQIFNAAALVLEVRTGNVLAYVGNLPSGADHHESVDIIRSPRSTGSILKPFLFAALLDEGKILPTTLVPDIPTIISGFSPKNFSRQYDGAVPADQALIRSLNIPAVQELREYRYEKFYDLLKNVGVTTLYQPADHYGLSLVLGGAEATLWDITSAYASLARTLNNYFERPGKNRYNKEDFHEPHYIPSLPEGLADDTHVQAGDEANSYLSAASLYLTFNTLKELYRPGEETGWRYFNSSKKIAWKTGTSFGFRDGWAVGVNPDYAVGVWVGNADGEGRPGLTGTEAAAPILFDIFSLLPGNSWFQQPRSEMTEIQVCKSSGLRAAELCDEWDTVWVSKAGMNVSACTYHKKIHLTPDKKFRVHSECESLAKIHSESWFVLPPVQEYYYKPHHASYKPLPPLRIDCSNPSSVAAMDLVYPKLESKIFVPRELDGSLGSTVFQVAHRDPSATIYWHLDGQFIGSTTKTHKLPLAPAEGNHVLTLVDGQGETLARHFKVISSM